MDKGEEYDWSSISREGFYYLHFRFGPRPYEWA
jgi:hypothetical protein